MARLVLDTSVVVKAMRNLNGASAQLVREAVSGRVEMLVSTPLGLEYEAVLMRQEHWTRPGWGVDQTHRFLDLLANAATPVELARDAVRSGRRDGA